MDGPELVKVDRDCPIESNGLLYFATLAGSGEVIVECQECEGVWTLKEPSTLGPGYGPFINDRLPDNAVSRPSSPREVVDAGYERLIES